MLGQSSLIWLTRIEKSIAIAIGVVGLNIAVGLIDIDRSLERSKTTDVKTKDSRMVKITEFNISRLKEKPFSEVLNQTAIKAQTKNTGVCIDVHTSCDRISLNYQSNKTSIFYVSLFNYGRTSKNNVIAGRLEQIKLQKVAKTGEWFWILGWSFVGGGLSLVWFQTDLWQKNLLDSIKLPIFSTAISIGTLFASSYILFLFGWWLPTFSALLAFAIANFSVTGYYYQNQRKIAFTDPLTKIANRRFCDRYLQRQWSKSQRQAKDLAVILCDVGFEKVCSETDGREINLCLKKTALLLSKSIRKVDFTARYGDREFIVVLPDSTVEAAIIVAKRILTKIQKIRICDRELEAETLINISMGIASLHHNKVVSIEELLNTADQALDRAKEGGSDRFIVSELEG